MSAEDDRPRSGMQLAEQGLRRPRRALNPPPAPEDLPVHVARNLGWLTDALAGVYRSRPEQASLVWLAGQELATVRNLAAVIARARNARAPLVPDETPAPPPKPKPGRPKGVGRPAGEPR